MTSLPEIDLERLKALHEKATAKPWKATRSTHGKQYLCVQLGTDEMYGTLELLPDDAALIAEIRNRLPDLIGEIERARRTLQNIETYVREAGDSDLLAGHVLTLIEQDRAALTPEPERT
jgi:hypothetical protein